MYSSLLWNIRRCSPLKVNRPFEGTYSLHSQGQRISQVRNQLEAGIKAGEREHVPPKRRLSFNELQSYVPVDTTLLIIIPIQHVFSNTT
jgi:hypothetical protein